MAALGRHQAAGTQHQLITTLAFKLESRFAFEAKDHLMMPMIMPIATQRHLSQTTQST
ncbi:hypothetical protein GCM10007392_29000 [Saccharospirillum salsuginis]|uniref:Uncharacterized protein n=1 Tax=Saccharospirillum salsuginis TaxID=418750 RepID=A0A918KD33_9GAMM|nr:hypothetical protein GCM10007392_29000 [Saccharospirillum salsuginis]